MFFFLSHVFLFMFLKYSWLFFCLIDLIFIITFNFIVYEICYLYFCIFEI